ncbi:ribonuclease E [Leifsonia sp. 98AMF]|uniref:Rne/Rng family ribonuclease n=1 Tax=unclassified Leifsonia TaxID=2663824 RepID=UPI00087B73DA|nr:MULTISPECIES: Rne/Rng family ribonuclease [unclassified Leifsonia]SDH30568.1 ribonuclease E [Leifsonia sp. 197AMF]SDJ04778.1 ribonuclease E [Leifsonia sp. 466MF]SDJ67658.1 ribonuclease E [Leifsonia sp. 157MF]SDN25130.1 ribonuclease E [Leifsonia sp. 509MF]SEM95304.1 ribonuclease E [Leifsonia sp. 467MF]
MVDNENIDNTDNNETETGGRKRKGLFGARRVVKKPFQAVQADAFPPSSGQSAAEQAAEPTAAEPEAAQAATVEETAPAAGEAAAQRALAADGVQPAAGLEPPALPDKHGEVEAPVVGAAAPGLPPTTLLFQAPDVLPLPPLPEGDEEPAGGVRRRSRRRAGESRDNANDPANTVVKVRTPREPELITEPQKVKGSTRLEAKKQRRRDGRDAGRRRPVITEAEFLARRESVDRQMVVRSKGGRIQIGVLEDKVLVEHYVARSQEASLIGNVYLGRVQNVLPSMEAAFVDIGRGRNAVLYSGEVDWDAVETGNQPRRIELALKPGDRVLVQVTKDPVGHKGARLTSQISLPGRYLVYVPGGSMNGISRKLPDTERSRLKKILKEVLPENAGVIVRTAAEGATEEQLTLDVTRLTSQWADISTRVETQQAPALLHSEPDLLIKIIRDVFNEDFQKLVIAGDDARQTIENYLRQVAPDLLDRVEPYTGERDAFDEFRITEQIEKALERKVWLPSGGSLVIDRTEAMTVVDVNTGKFVGSGGNLEETVTKNNLEAAEEIVRQLRLRDIGGIIVVDFIDMVLESNRDLVLRRLVECLSRDRTKHQVAEVTSLGLVQMTRKKLGLGLLETFSEACEVCAGRGVIVHHDPVVKHRQPQQPQNERRRGRGGSAGGSSNGGSNGSGNGNGGNGAGGHNGTHAITDDAKNALAKIAASTIHHDEEAKAQENAASADVEQISVTEVTLTEVTATKKRRRKGKGGADRQQAETTPSEDAVSEPASEQPAEGSAEAAPEAGASEPSAEPILPLLDLPEPAEVRPTAARPSPEEAELLLDSVLEALPAPKEPGQGRNRSRRASTAVIAGGELAPKGE